MFLTTPVKEALLTKAPQALTAEEIHSGDCNHVKIPFEPPSKHTFTCPKKHETSVVVCNKLNSRPAPMVDIDPPSQDANLWSPSPFSIDLLARGLLVVADSERQRVVAIDILNSLGFQQIIEAENGGGALALLATHSPAVLIVDLEMPNKDGIELIHQTRICSLEALARWRTNRQTTW